MDIFQKDIITIIRSALTEKNGTLSAAFDLTSAIKLAKAHNILSLFYNGAVLCGVPADNPPMAELFGQVCKTVMVDVRQIAMINKLTQAFDSNNIDFLLLKGTILKKLYPKSEMRTMGDADILIKVSQYPQIEEILKKLNFTFKCETDHELIWTNPSLFLELHKSVMTSYNKDFYNYFNTGWALANKVPDTNSEYQFKAEDFYIYIFVHFAKHYRISGIGIKHILDLWVYSNAYPKMDYEYIFDILKKLKLLEFHQNVTDTLKVWFDGASPNKKTALITNVIFSSGQYGTAEMSNINRTIRESKNNGSDSIRFTKAKRLFKTLFPSFPSMKKHYPVLEKIPLILPFLWVFRWIEIVILKRKDLQKYVHNLNAINQSAVNKNQQALNFVGLDFNIEE